jgi:hypothetical protein
MARNAFFRSDRKYGIVPVETAEARYPWTEGFDDVVSLSVMGYSPSDTIDQLAIYPCSNEESIDSTGYCNLVTGTIASRNDLSVKQAGKYIDGAYVAINALLSLDTEVQHV